MRIARIARPEALYGASVLAQTFEAADEAILNPIDFDGIADLDLAKATGGIKNNHIRRCDEFMGKYSMGSNRVNLREKIKDR